jgi:hypothetical protein
MRICGLCLLLCCGLAGLASGAGFLYARGWMGFYHGVKKYTLNAKARLVACQNDFDDNSHPF